MSDATKKPQSPSDAPAAESAKAPQRPAAPATDDGTANTIYANFYRVSGLPEELVLDFAFNPQAGAPNEGAIKIDHRVILNYFTAKRLLGHLLLVVQRHEAVFGAIETDVNKRVQAPNR